VKHELIEVRGKRFDRERITLDGHSFVGCTFIDCTVAFRGGECSIEDSLFVRPQLEMSGAAANTAEVLHALGALNERMFDFPE